MDVLQKIKKIGKLMGERSVFRIGVDTKNGRIDLLSVDVCNVGSEEVVAELPETEIPDYIG